LTILVTGGAGFIGSHIVDSLIETGYDVCVLDNLSSGNISNINRDAKFYRFDLRDDLSSIFIENKIDCCIHQAAQVSVSKSMSDPFMDSDININGTLNLLKYCVNYDVKKFIYASSAAVYGTPQYLPIDELHPKNPTSFYGISKLTPEFYIKTFAQIYNFKYVIFRYSNVYGPRQDPFGEGGVVSIFSQKMIDKDTVEIYGTGEQTRDFIYVKDVAYANLKAIDYQKDGVFNLSTGKRISINELFRTMVGLTGYDKIPVYKEKRLGDIDHSCLDNSLLIKEFNWVPQYSLEEGLRYTVQYFKDKTV